MSNNTNYGFGSLHSNSGDNNNAFGSYSLYNNTTADNNIAIGTNTLFYNTVGNNNTAVGSGSMVYNTAGSDNTALGSSALEGIVGSSGSNNVAIGAQSLYNNQGNFNTSIGCLAGYNQNSSYNTFLGAKTDCDVSNNSYQYSTAIGYGAKINSSNQIMMGGTGPNGYPSVVFPGRAIFLNGTTGASTFGGDASFNNLTVTNNFYGATGTFNNLTVTNKFYGATGTFNYLQGVTGSYFSGVTSNIQNQITSNTSSISTLQTKTNYINVTTDSASNTVTSISGPVLLNGNSSNISFPTTSSIGGLEILWNPSGYGYTELINYAQAGTGGFKFSNVNNTANSFKQILNIDNSGKITAYSNIDVSSNNVGITTSAGTLTNAVLGYLYGTTSNVQTQINTLQSGYFSNPITINSTNNDDQYIDFFYNGSSTDNPKVKIRLNNTDTSQYNGTLDVFGNLDIYGLATYSNDDFTSYTSNTLVSKEYVDTYVSGISVKAAVLAATVSSTDVSGWTYDGSNNITIDTSTLTLDGVDISMNNYVLIKDPSNNLQNGVYYYEGDNTYTLHRRSDMLYGADVTGAYVFVQSGTVQAATAWVLSSTPAVVGTNPLTFSQFSNFSFKLGNGLFLENYNNKNYINVDNSLNFVNYLDSTVGPTGSTGILNIGSVTNTINIGNSGTSTVNFTSGVTGPTGSFNYVSGSTGQFSYLQGVTGSYFSGVTSNIQNQITSNTSSISTLQTKTNYLTIATDGASNTVTSISGPVFLNNGTSTNSLPTTSSLGGLEILWNTSGYGYTGLINYAQGGTGGFKFYTVNNTANSFKQILNIDNSGKITAYSNIDVSSNNVGITTSTGTLTNAELGYLYGTTSNVQNQINTLNTILTNVSYSNSSTNFRGYVQFAFNNAGLVPNITTNSCGYVSGNYTQGDAEVDFFSTGYTQNISTQTAFRFYKYTTSSTVNLISYITNSGSVCATNFQSLSDYRIKENIQLLDDTFTVDNLKPVTYHNTLSDKQGIGFIAHEVQENFPCLVHGEKDEIDGKGDNKYQSLDYTGIIAILVKEIQDLKKEVKELKARL